MTAPTLGSLTPFAARFAAVLAILGSSLFLLSTIAFVTVGNGINNGVVGGVITVWACLTLIPAFAGIYRLLEPDRPRLAAWLTLVASAAFIGGTGFGAGAIIEEALGSDANLMIDQEHPFSLLALLPWGWMAPITFVAAGIALWRAGVVPRWNGLLLILGGILFVTGRPARIDAIAILTDVVLLVALSAIAVRLFAAARVAGTTDTGTERRAARA